MLRGKAIGPCIRFAKCTEMLILQNLAILQQQRFYCRIRLDAYPSADRYHRCGLPVYKVSEQGYLGSWGKAWSQYTMICGEHILTESIPLVYVDTNLFKTIEYAA